jgi:hypothetical protein
MENEDEILSNEHDFLSVIYDKSAEKICVVQWMTFDDFVARICTGRNGRRITTMHIYADSVPAKQIVDATPRWVEMDRHPSLVDY